MEEPRLDEFFREKIEDFAAPAYDPAAWAKLEPRMTAPIASPILWYWISGVLGALLVFSWLYFLSAPSGERQIVQQLDSLQQQISKLTTAQSQIQKDTVFVYLSNDSLLQLISKTDTSNSSERTLTQAQNSSIGRSANSRTNTSFNPKVEVNPPSVFAEGNLVNPSSNPIAPHSDTSSLVVIPSGNAQPGQSKAQRLETPVKSLEQVEASASNKADSSHLAKVEITQNPEEADSVMTLAEERPSPRDTSRSVRPQPQTPVKKERSRILQNWLQAREIRAGLQMAGASLWASNVGAGFQSYGGLYMESNLNQHWWIQTGIDLGYRSYEGENEEGDLPQDLLDALPGLVDPFTAAELKEFYMNGLSFGIPLAIRREFHLNRNWDMGIQGSMSVHRYLQQSFDYQSFDEEELNYLSRGVEQRWTLSPLRLTVMAIHRDRFRPSIGLYTEYDMMARGVEPIRFWSVGLQATFGLQLK